MRRLLLAMLLGLLGGPAFAQPVKVGDLGILADAPLSTNQVQVVGGGVSAALYNAFARGWPVRIAMARTRDWPGYSSDTLVLRNDLKSTVTSARQLKGKMIAINTPASVLHFMLA